MSAWSHRVRSCSASGMSSPSGPVRAGRRASVSSISASRPATSGLVGQRRVQRAGEPDRLIGQVGPGDVRAGAGDVPLVEDQVEHVQDSPQPLAPLARRGIRNGASGGPDALLGAADPLGHRASGTRNAAAISAVVRPPTARRVSGIADAGREHRMAAQEQQQQRIVLVGTARRARPAPRAADQLLAVAAGLIRTPDVGQPPGGDGRSASPAGCPGTPRGHWVAAASSASCTASSASAKSPYRRTTRRGPAAPAHAADPRCRCGRSPLRRRRVHDRPDLDRLAGRPPPGPGAADVWAAISMRPLLAVDVHHPEPGQELLGLREDPSVTTGAPTPSLATTFVASGPASFSAASSSPASVSSWCICCMCAQLALTSSRCPLLDRVVGRLGHHD